MSIGIRYMISFSWHRKPRWLAPLALWFLGFEKMLKQLEAAVGDCGYRRRPPWKEGTTTRVANYFRINHTHTHSNIVGTNPKEHEHTGVTFLFLSNTW